MFLVGWAATHRIALELGIFLVKLNKASPDFRSNNFNVPHAYPASNLLPIREQYGIKIMGI